MIFFKKSKIRHYSITGMAVFAISILISLGKPTIVLGQAPLGGPVDVFYADAISISLPQAIQMNQPAQITVQLTKPSPNWKSGDRFNVGIALLKSGYKADVHGNLCGDSYVYCTSVYTSPAQTGNTATVSFTPSAANFTANQQTTILVTMDYSYSGVGTGDDIYQGVKQITVAPASTTGSPSITLTAQPDSIFTSTVGKNFIVNYNAGASGRTPLNYTYDCGYPPDGSGKGILKYPSNNNNLLTCTYPGTANSYTLSVNAIDASGPILPSAVTQPISITGTEGKQAGANFQSSGLGDPITKFINDVLRAIFSFLQSLIYFIFTTIVSPVLTGVLSIRTYTDTFAAVIYPGWEVIRNTCNILFIVSLIAIGLGTLFRVESYQYRHMLVQLIIAVLLVNFSLVMGQAVLGLADTVQNQFLPNNQLVVNKLASVLMLQLHNTFITTSQSNAFPADKYFSATIWLFFELSMTLGSFVVFVAITAFLVIRIVALWVLLMISPIAYAGGALPSTVKYRSMWWQNFIKYAFFTPVMAFCLNLAAYIADKQANNPVFQQVLSNPTAVFGPGNSNIAPFVFSVGSDVILLVFLLAALMVAQQAGVMGGDIATKWGKAAMLAPFKYGIGGPAKFGQFLAGKGVGRLGRFWNDFTTGKHVIGEKDKVTLGRRVLFATLNPVAFWKQMGARGKELAEASHHKADAAGMMAAEQLMTGGKKVIPRIQQHAKAEADKFLKDYGQMSREKQVDVLKDVSQMGHSEEAKAMKRAITTAMLSRGFVDDGVQDGTRTVDADGHTAAGSKLLNKMLQNKKFKVENMEADIDAATGLQKRDASGKLMWKENEDWYYDSRDGEYKMKYNDKTMAAMMEALYGTDDQEAMRMLAEEGEKYGKDTYHSEFMRMAHYDLEHGEYRWSLDMAGGKQGKNFAAGEISKMDARQQAKVVYHALMGLTNTGEIEGELLAKVEKAIREMPAWMQERNPDNIIFGREIQAGDSTNMAGKNFNKDDGSIRLDKATYLRMRNLTDRMNKPEVWGAIYLKATGGALTNGKYDQTTVVSFANEMKKIQSATFQTEYAGKKADLAAGRISADDFKKYMSANFSAIDHNKVDALVRNKGIKVEVYDARDRDYTHAESNVDDLKGVSSLAAQTAYRTTGRSVSVAVAPDETVKFG